MAGTTVVGLVHMVHERAVATGVELSAKDTAFILSLFFEGLAASGPSLPAVDAWLQMIADEVNKVKDET